MYYFIVNPASRTGMGKHVWRQVKHELNKRNIPYQVVMTEYPHHPEEITKKLCQDIEGPFTIVTLGGDGTANEVLNSIPAEDMNRITFAYLPSGSGNDLARGLGISRDPLIAVQEMLTGNYLIDMDYGNIKMDGQDKPHRFATSAGLGFDAGVCEGLEHSSIKKWLNKIKLGKLSYLFVALKQILFGPTADFTLTIDDGTPKEYKRVFFVAAMNQRSEGGGLQIAPKAIPTDGKLSLCIVHNFYVYKALILLPALMMGGKHTKFRSIEMIDCRKVEIHTSEPLCLHSDGEVLGHHDHVILSISDDTVRVSAGSERTF